MKKISIPDIISYQVKLIEKIKSVLKRVLWKAHFFLNQSKKQDNIKTTYGFKSKLHPQQHPDLEAFEEKLCDIMKFRKVKDAFQTTIKKDISKINKSPNKFIFALKPIAFIKC